MARQGNYVSVPGGNANWTKDISRSLMDLSSSFISQGNEEDERARLAKAAEENKRRYEADKAYQLERDSVLDVRHLETQAAAQARWQAEQDESTRRFNIQQAHRNQQAKELQKERDNKAMVNKLSWDLANTEHTFTEDAYPEHMKTRLGDLRSRVTNEKEAMVNFLSGKGGTADVLDLYRKDLTSSGFPQSGINQKVSQREFEMMGLREQLAGMDDPQQVQNRIDQVVGKIYTPRLAELDDQISKGAGLTQEQKTDYILGKIPQDMRSSLDYNAAKAAVAGQIDGPTRASLLANEKTRVDRINETALKNIELADKYYQRAIAAKKPGTSYSRNSKGVVNALQAMGDVDIGWWDTADARKGFDLMVNSHGVDPEVAAAAIHFGINKGTLGDSFPSVTSDEFTRLVHSAKSMQGAKSTGRNGKVYIDPKRYVYTPAQERGLAALQQQNLRLSKLGTESLVNDPTFGRPQQVISAAKSPAPTPVVRELPVPQETKPLEVANLPGSMGLSVQALSPEIRNAMDLTWPQQVVSGGVRSPERPFTPKEAISRDVLSAVQNIQGIKERLERVSSARGTSYNRNAVRMYEEQLKEAESNLESLKRQLLR